MEQPSEGKRFYGAITVSERGQIVIPASARRDFNIQVGDKLLVLGDLEQGIGLIKASALFQKAPGFFSMLQGEPNPTPKTRTRKNDGDRFSNKPHQNLPGFSTEEREFFDPAWTHYGVYRSQWCR